MSSRSRAGVDAGEPREQLRRDQSGVVHQAFPVPDPLDAGDELRQCGAALRAPSALRRSPGSSAGGARRPSRSTGPDPAASPAGTAADTARPTLNRRRPPTRVDQLRQLVAVVGPRDDQREDQELRAPLLQLGVLFFMARCNISQSDISNNRLFNASEDRQFPTPNCQLPTGSTLGIGVSRGRRLASVGGWPFIGGEMDDSRGARVDAILRGSGGLR